MKIFFAGNNGGNGEVSRDLEIGWCLLLKFRLLSYYEIVGNKKQQFSFQLLKRLDKAKEAK